jgi:hypothetical protein
MSLDVPEASIYAEHEAIDGIQHFRRWLAFLFSGFMILRNRIIRAFAGFLSSKHAHS